MMFPYKYPEELCLWAVLPKPLGSINDSIDFKAKIQCSNTKAFTLLITFPPVISIIFNQQIQTHQSKAKKSKGNR